jgi:hypothetical protein
MIKSNSGYSPLLRYPELEYWPDNTIQSSLYFLLSHSEVVPQSLLHSSYTKKLKFTVFVDLKINRANN